MTAPATFSLDAVHAVARQYQGNASGKADVQALLQGLDAERGQGLFTALSYLTQEVARVAPARFGTFRDDLLAAYDQRFAHAHPGHRADLIHLLDHTQLSRAPTPVLRLAAKSLGQAMKLSAPAVASRSTRTRFQPR